MNPQIIPIEGEPWRFRVRSRSRPEVLHLVDAETCECSCETHQFRVEPARSRGEWLEDCPHVRMVRDHLLNKFIALVNRERRKKSA